MNEAQELLKIINDTESQEIKNKRVQKVIKNTSIPLDNRWELYTTAVDDNYLVEEGWYYFESKVLSELEDQGYNGENRNAQYQYYDILEGFDNKKEEDSELTDEDLVILKEEILADGSSYWTYDW